MSIETIKSISLKNQAHLAGFLYLLMTVLALAAEFIFSGLVVTGDGAATAAKIASAESLFRAGFVIDIAWIACYLLAAWALYVLLKRVGKNMALLFLLLTTASVAVLCLNTLNEFAALLLASNPGYMTAFTTDQLNSLVAFFLDLKGHGYYAAQIFFSLWLFPLGYLVYKSGFLPRTLGILLVMGGFGLLLEFFVHFCLPGYEVITYPGLAISTIAEFAFCLYLLIKGVIGEPHVTERRQQTAIAE
jgi:hypothetical protein